MTLKTPKKKKKKKKKSDLAKKIFLPELLTFRHNIHNVKQKQL